MNKPTCSAMKAKWNEPTNITIRIPSIQAILLAILLLGSIGAIACVSIAVQNETPHGPTPTVAVPVEGPAAWLSAQSTFWGAVAGGIGAIGTAGALWLGALTFFRQVRDQHRAQSSRVIVVMDKGKGKGAGYLSPKAVVTNMSGLPIYKVRLRAAPHDALDDGMEESIPVLVDEWPIPIPGKYIEHSVHVEFQDSAGTTWIRWVGGSLTEKKGEEYEIE
ncbi:hypothetical protein [Paenarthrobacter aurescens]|uniref:hypothetical protein n=1 Tax=Paenarthrobacter aurescens TaxID=43663 RepID=UPI0021C119BF|nr:hypothetical protein [Paenarthrobacter aurescens]MCT9868355.1 hypothetical protein [Paenarthrobacter aurescens]